MAPSPRRLPPPLPPEALRAHVVAEVSSEALELDVPTRAVPPPLPPEALLRAQPRRAPSVTPPPLPAAARARRRVSTAPDITPVEEPRDLVDAARAGDVRAFNALVHRYRPRILALALHLTGSANDADDIAQDVFLKAFQRLTEFEGRSAFFTWIYRIALNRSLQVIQQRRVRQGVDLDDPRVALAVAVDAGGAPARALELRETYAHLVYAFDRLSPLLRTTVVLTTLQGLSHPEAAAVLGTTEGTIAWRMHEAREQLRRAVDAAAASASVKRTHSPEATAERAARRPVSGTQRVTRRQRDLEPDAMSCSLALALASVVSA